MSPSRPRPGIRERHGRRCAKRLGASCSCQPGYEAFAYDATARRKLRRTFPSPEKAEAWRAEMTAAVRLSDAGAAVTEVRTMIEHLIDEQRRTFGEAIPHLSVLLETALRLERMAQRDAKALGTTDEPEPLRSALGYG